MARKAKKKMHAMPKLSLLDKCIYWGIMLILSIAYLALLFGPLALREVIAFADETVIAAEEHWSELWLIIPWMTFFLMTFILWLTPYQDRRPIFGLKNFKYGPPAWPKVYPLFMKNKPYVWVSEKKKQSRKQVAAVLLVVLLLSFIPLPWSLYGRNCLHTDGSMADHNMFDKVVREYDSGEIASVEFSTCRYSTGKYSKTRHWGVAVTLTTDDGREYTFLSTEFRYDKDAEAPFWLTAMTALKRRYSPQIITYSGQEDLDRVLSNHYDTEANRQLLYRLFEQEVP